VRDEGWDLAGPIPYPEWLTANWTLAHSSFATVNLLWFDRPLRAVAFDRAGRLRVGDEEGRAFGYEVVV